MAKIKIETPNTPYATVVETGANEVTIEEAYIGIGFKTKENRKLSVCMRDGGYEVRYTDEHGRSTPWIPFNDSLEVR